MSRHWENIVDAYLLVGMGKSYLKDQQSLTGEQFLAPADHARNLVEPLQQELGPVAVMSFRKLPGHEFIVEARLPMPDVSLYEHDLVLQHPEDRDELVVNVDKFVDRLRKSLPDGVWIRDGYSIRTARGVFDYDEIVERWEAEREANGGHVRNLSPKDLAEIISVQVGSHVILADPQSDAFIVGRIDDEGLCEPIKAHLRIEEAEDLLKSLTKDADPIWNPYF